MLLLAACSEPTGQHGIALSDVQVRAIGKTLEVRVNQKVQLSRAAVRAIRNGVDLTLSRTLEVRTESRGTVALRDEQSYVISYLPMSERFQLRDNQSGQVQNFPRLRHVLRALARNRIILTPDSPLRGNYELRMRLRLDRASLPAPMQIPALLFDQWHHDSGWTEWPFTIDN